MSPAGLFAVLAMPLVGVMLGRGTDARWLIAAGLLVMAAGNYWMSQMNLDISPGQVVWPRVVIVAGSVDMLRAGQRGGLPLHADGAAGSGRRPVEPAAQRGRQRRHVDGADAAGAARSIPHAAARRVSRSLQSGREFLRRAGAGAFRETGDPAALQQLAWQALENLRQQQASALAYFDCFWIFAVVTLALVLVVPLMKRSVAEKGAHIGSE